MPDPLEEKLDRLLRYHRQRVFDANGDRHSRAITCLKATPTAQRIWQRRVDAAAHRRGQDLLRLWA